MERDKQRFSDRDFVILDMYNEAAYPRDDACKAAIDIDVPLQPGCGTKEYLERRASCVLRAACKC